jgi:ABC-type nickel/cobalt efflux system permease component RcnA
MSVIPLTLTISLCLVFTFVVFFLRENSRRRFSSAERESLLPLAEETPRVARAHEHHDQHKHHQHDGCGCKDGSRPPCAGCLKRR